MTWEQLKELELNEFMLTVNKMLIDNELNSVRQLDTFLGLNKGTISGYTSRKGLTLVNGQLELKAYNNTNKENKSPKTANISLFDKVNELKQGDTITTTIKINTELNEQLKEVLEKYRIVTKQDLINLAIKELIERIQ